MSEEKIYKYIPDRVSHPGETLLELLEERGMTQVELSERMGRPLKTINEIIKGKAAITPETAIQLERVFGVPNHFWNQNEANYRAYLASKMERERLKEHKNWLAQFPLKEMQDRGLIEDCGDDVFKSIISILNFFGVASPEQWNFGWTQQRLAFRKARNLKTDAMATNIWLRQGEIIAERKIYKPFHKETLLNSLSEIRELTKESDPRVFISKLETICENCGVGIIFIKPFPGVSVYGASYWLTHERALIQLSLRDKTADAFWFTIFHELAHILKHNKKEFFVEMENNDDHVRKSPEEQEADTFASETLIPSVEFEKWVVGISSFTRESITQFAKHINIAPGILVSRLQYLKYIKYSEFNELKIKCDWSNL